LNAAYIQRTLRDFANARRKNNRSPVMATIAKGMTPDEMREAAEYFAARKPGAGYMKVVEAAEVPKTFVGEGAMRFVSPGNDKEPIGSRIIVVPQDEEGAKARNPHTGFVAYVPPGSIAKGEQLATSGGNGKTVPCAICHGEGLKGLGDVPLAPAHGHQEGQPHRRLDHADAAGGRQARYRRHHRARLLRGVAATLATLRRAELRVAARLAEAQPARRQERAGSPRPRPSSACAGGQGGGSAFGRAAKASAGS
jgi:cytochrome c553